MTRIILFTLFLCLCAFLLNLAGYKKVHDQSIVLNSEYLSKTLENNKKEKEALLLAKNKKAEPEEEKKAVLDMNDPKIKNGFTVYSEGKNCLSCHGEKAQGNPEVKAPLLAGQHDWYIIDQIAQIDSGKRAIDNSALSAHQGLTEQETKDVAKYISLLRLQ